MLWRLFEVFRLWHIGSGWVAFTKQNLSPDKAGYAYFVFCLLCLTIIPCYQIGLLVVTVSLQRANFFYSIKDFTKPKIAEIKKNAVIISFTFFEAHNI